MFKLRERDGDFLSFMTGVYLGKKKNGEIYYRSSITYMGKHISLGSYNKELHAHFAYKEADNLLENDSISIDNYSDSNYLLFEKWVTLINFRDHKIYIKSPIYLKRNYFLYYLTRTDIFKFDIDDLFYYSTHKIMKRNGHLFAADYGMQVNILSRYNIKNYAVAGVDYEYINGDFTDYRYENIKIINPYYGVKIINKKLYLAKIHIRGDYIIGYYNTDIEAAIAYNKSVDILRKKGLYKNFFTNYIDTISPKVYADIYSELKISKKILNYSVKQSN